jgi:hypothetical protein
VLEKQGTCSTEGLRASSLLQHVRSFSIMDSRLHRLAQMQVQWIISRSTTDATAVRAPPYISWLGETKVVGEKALTPEIKGGSRGCYRLRDLCDLSLFVRGKFIAILRFICVGTNDCTRMLKTVSRQI